MRPHGDENLPPGTIIQRTIRGKTRFYHQWRENGKTLSRYLKSDEILPLRELIERRKALEKANARARVLKAADASAKSARTDFACGILTGHRLVELGAAAGRLRPRSLLTPVVRFLDEPHPDRILLLEGLPGTGKSTLLRQAVRAMDADAVAESACLSIPADVSSRDFLADVHALAERGVTRLLVDGLDRAPALRETVPVLEDVFSAAGMRLVISASTPHGLTLSARTETVSTTFQSFADFQILGAGDSVADYLRGGGPTEAQVDAATLQRLGSFNRHALIRELLPGAGRRAEWSVRLANDIHRIFRAHAARAQEALAADDVSRLTRLGLVAAAEDETYLTAPGLRHALSARLMRDLLSDESAAHLGAAERKIVEEAVLRRVQDRTLADLVLHGLVRTRKSATTDVFRLRFPSGGYDAVVADRDELTCELYEVRCEPERNDRQLENLENADMLDTVEHRYGTIVSRTLVYLGRNAWHASGIAYRNAVPFL